MLSDTKRDNCTLPVQLIMVNYNEFLYVNERSNNWLMPNI